MPILQSVCLGLRLASLFLLSVMHVREHIPGSVDGRVSVVPVNDTVRYERGEISWHQFRDDVIAIDKQIEMCEKNAVNGTIDRQLGCWIQRQKLSAKRFLLCLLKNSIGFTVDWYESERIALTGHNAVVHFLKLLLTLGFVIVSIYTFYTYRTIILNAVRDWFQRCIDYFRRHINYYWPATPEPTTSVNVSPPYISDETRAYMQGDQGTASNTSLSSSSLQSSGNMDHYEGGELLDPGRLEDTASERSVPRSRGSFHRMSPNDATNYGTPPRSLPRRQRSFSPVDDDGLLDDNDNIGPSAARGTHRPQHRGFDTGDGGEPVTSAATKKKVVFKEDLIDSRTRREGRRSDEPRDDLSLIPRPRVPPRAGRSGPRGRRGGAAVGARR